MDLYGDPYRAATRGKEKERQYSTYGIKAKRFNWAMWTETDEKVKTEEKRENKKERWDSVIEESEEIWKNMPVRYEIERKSGNSMKL